MLIFNCLFCDGILSGDKRKKFCNRSCAASFNNSKNPKRKAVSTSNCVTCGAQVSLTKKTKKSGSGYYKRKYCDGCLFLLKIFNMTSASSEEDFLINQTKGSLYARRKNWQSANSTLRRHARKVYAESRQPQVCKVCGYDKHIEISHIKSVKDFSDDAKVLEINAIDNLIGLCPNHHWEFDNGLIQLDGY